MYDKILRHRHTIEAQLASNSVQTDLSGKSLVTSAESEEELDKAQKLISYIISAPNDEFGDLGLTNLTCESVMAKMEQKVPLGLANSWDPATSRNENNVQESNLHIQVTRASSDSYVQSFSKLNVNTKSSSWMKNRRKLESEDSSYGSDHEEPKHRPICSLWTPHREDVSRTVSETLASEYAEYIDHFDSIEAMKMDKNYESNLIRALKLGYSETQLQKALLKLGKKAREDQILEELVRIQKSSKPMPEEAKPVKIQAEIQDPEISTETLLPIIIDGSNLAMSHGNKECFSCRGIKICVDWFRNRGHKEITVFVPMWRKESSKPETPATDQHILTELEREKFLTFTPSRIVSGRRFVCHDDRYILNLAAENGGIVVSNDNYRELINEKPKFKEVIEERILMYSFVNDRFMPPDDPLGKNGPTLDQFLRKKVRSSELPKPCPYGKKCTYGNKCKFYHPDRAPNQKNISDKLKEYSSPRINEVRARGHSRDSSPGDPLTRTRSIQPKQNSKQLVYRTKSSVPRLEHNNWGNNWPVVDTSMPPPPPRTPWSASTDPKLNTGHAKLSRQYSVNPNFDARIHGGNSPDFSKPPPALLNQHMVVTRNASDQQQNLVLQQHLQKTWSSPAMESPISPILGNMGIWGVQDQNDPRSNMFYDLSRIFPEDTVRRAMADLPHETDPKVICQHICSMENKP